jgi:hypothetical protein
MNVVEFTSYGTPAPFLNQTPGKKLENCLTAIYNGSSSEDPSRVARRALKGSAIVISFTAKIPYIPIALGLGRVLGPVSAVGNTAAFFILEYWAAINTINDIFWAKTPIEIELVKGDCEGKGEICKTLVIITTVSLISLSAQLPTALAGVKYNEPQYKVVAGLVLLIAGALIPARSLQLSMEYFHINAQKTVESEITKIKEKMVGLIQTCHEKFIEKTDEDKVTFVQQCRKVQRDSSSEEETNKYTLTLLQQEELPVSQVQRNIRTVCNYTGMGIGTILAGIFEYALGDYTFKLTEEEVWDNKIAAGVLATLAVGSTAYLCGRSIIGTTQRIFNVLGDFATGKEIRNFGWQLRPKLSFSLTAIGLLTDVCALGPTYVIWGDFYNKDVVQHEFFQKTMCASLFLLLFTATLDIIDDVVTSSIARGTDEEKEIFKINGEFQKLAVLFEKSPSREFIGYLMHMDREDQKELLERISVSAEQLAVYANTLGLIQEESSC